MYSWMIGIGPTFHQWPERINRNRNMKPAIWYRFRYRISGGLKSLLAWSKPTVRWYQCYNAERQPDSFHRSESCSDHKMLVIHLHLYVARMTGWCWWHRANVSLGNEVFDKNVLTFDVVFQFPYGVCCRCSGSDVTLRRYLTTQWYLKLLADLVNAKTLIIHLYYACDGPVIDVGVLQWCRRRIHYE